MWFWATFNEVQLSENSTDTKMFSETWREHSKDQRTLGGQVSLQTHCHDDPGTQMWSKTPCWGTVFSHQGQNGARHTAL